MSQEKSPKIRKLTNCKQREVNNDTLETISYFYKINRLLSLVTGQCIYKYIFLIVTVQLPLY